MSYGLSGQVILANFTNSAYFLHHTGSVVISYWQTLHCPYFVDMRNTRGGSLVFGGRQFQRAFFFSFPKLTLSPCFLVCLWRHLHADAAMWAFLVVELNESSDTYQCVIVVKKTFLAIYNLRLQYAVHTFCDGVVSWLVVLVFSRNRFTVV